MRKLRPTKPWPSTAAIRWQKAQPWRVGCNYIPRTAINPIEMWDRKTFDPKTIRQELTWAAAMGMNAVRVFLHDLVWEADRKTFLANLSSFLTIAAERGIGVMPVFFDSVWHPFPHAGRQPAPQPGVHNSGWVQSPGVAILRDEKRFDRLSEYVRSVVGAFADDERVIVWDIWNEPDNSNPNSYGPRDAGAEKVSLIMKYLPRVAQWVRQARPKQPITCGIWAGDWQSAESLKPHERMQLELSDVISFHCYGDAADLSRRIVQLQQYGRPVMCTEFMSRGSGSTFAATLPVLQQHRIDAYCWGLVEGKTQTNYPWDSWQRPYAHEPTPWFHDVLRKNGKPYDPAEVELIRSTTSTGAKRTARKRA